MRSYRKRVREDRQEDNPHVEYEMSPKGDKITAKLKDTTSARLTNLGKDIDTIRQLDEQIKALRQKAEDEARAIIAELFDADDEVRTRVVETVSFYLKISKMPEPTQSVAWAKVVKELQENLTPELIEVLKDLKEKYTTVVQKRPGLTYKSTKESKNLNEGVLDKLGAFFKKFLNYITGWCKKYDSQLDALKAEVGM